MLQGVVFHHDFIYNLRVHEYSNSSQELHDVTSQKTAFFIVTAVKASNSTFEFRFIIRNHAVIESIPVS
jgi:hypothetical protein